MIKILSLVGGDIRGLIPALILAEIEKRVEKLIAKCFDLMAGTSTGGILSLGLAKNNGNGEPEYKAADLADICQQRGKEIFSGSFWKGFSSIAGITNERYPISCLAKVLEEEESC